VVAEEAAEDAAPGYLHDREAMTSEALPEGLVTPMLTQEKRNEVILRVAERMAEDLKTKLKRLYPDYVFAPGTKEQPRDRLRRYLTQILIAYQGDVMAAQAEVDWLLNPDYRALVKQGLAPPPQSKPWNMVIMIGFVFDDLQRDFREIYRAELKRQGVI
jgi:hypothetical protein